MDCFKLSYLHLYSVLFNYQFWKSKIALFSCTWTWNWQSVVLGSWSWSRGTLRPASTGLGLESSGLGLVAWGLGLRIRSWLKTLFKDQECLTFELTLYIVCSIDQTRFSCLFVVSSTISSLHLNCVTWGDSTSENLWEMVEIRIEQTLWATSFAVCEGFLCTAETIVLAWATSCWASWSC